jgi:hypothetical protein
LESELQFITPEELVSAGLELGLELKLIEGATQNLADQVKELHDGKQLWRLFLLLALACLLIETILIRIL